MKEYWLVTMQSEFGVSTFSIDEHPADWLAKYGQGCFSNGEGNPRATKHLVFAMPVSEEQHKALEAVGYQ